MVCCITIWFSLHNINVKRKVHKLLIHPLFTVTNIKLTSSLLFELFLSNHWFEFKGTLWEVLQPKGNGILSAWSRLISFMELYQCEFLYSIFMWGLISQQSIVGIQQNCRNFQYQRKSWVHVITIINFYRVMALWIGPWIYI